MGRPSAVNFKTFHEYDKLHSHTTHQITGTKITVLYHIKETAQFYRSIPVWAYCASTFKRKKKNLELKVDLPMIEDPKTIEFLEEHCWKDWTTKEKENNDMVEALAMLKKVYPDHEAIYFYELDSIISAYIWNSFTDDKEHSIDRAKRFHSKYHYHLAIDESPEVEAAYKEYHAAQAKLNEDKTPEAEKLKSEAFRKYYDLNLDYLYKNHNINDILINIGSNAVCYPTAFSRNTAEWSREKYGKLVGYAHVGEIYFVATKDKIYFEFKRHY